MDTNSYDTQLTMTATVVAQRQTICSQGGADFAIQSGNWYLDLLWANSS